MVVAGHSAATLAGIAALKRGGSIVDAMVAASAALTVTVGQATSIGGDCFLLFHEAKSGRTVGLNASGTAPQGATPERFPDGMKVHGPLAPVVPGLVRAWDVMHRRYGMPAVEEPVRRCHRARRRLSGLALAGRAIFILDRPHQGRSRLRGALHAERTRDRYRRHAAPAGAGTDIAHDCRRWRRRFLSRRHRPAHRRLLRGMRRADPGVRSRGLRTALGRAGYQRLSRSSGRGDAAEFARRLVADAIERALRDRQRDPDGRCRAPRRLSDERTEGGGGTEQALDRRSAQRCRMRSPISPAPR